MSNLQSELQTTLKGLGKFMKGLDLKLEEIKDKIPADKVDEFNEGKLKAESEMKRANDAIRKATEQLRDIKL